MIIKNIKVNACDVIYMRSLTASFYIEPGTERPWCLKGRGGILLKVIFDK